VKRIDRELGDRVKHRAQHISSSGANSKSMSKEHLAGLFGEVVETPESVEAPERSIHQNGSDHLFACRRLSVVKDSRMPPRASSSVARTSSGWRDNSGARGTIGRNCG